MMVRLASEADQAGVVALWHACGLTRPWNDPDADFARAVSSASSAVLVVEADEALVATVMVGDDGHRGWIYYLAVAPTARGNGLGRELMAAAETWLRARGCLKLQLMVRADNAAALGFYTALGLDEQSVVTLGKFLKDDR
jgi:ribosomal protein S18 acetylase RimI-like enzyme